MSPPFSTPQRLWVFCSPAPIPSGQGPSREVEVQTAPLRCSNAGCKLGARRTNFRNSTHIRSALCDVVEAPFELLLSVGMEMGGVCWPLLALQRGGTSRGCWSPRPRLQTPPGLCSSPCSSLPPHQIPREPP